jgi:hypothetical protein
MVKDKKLSIIEKLSAYVHNHVTVLNNSKIFAGFMIIVINIASRFVTFKLSKTVESYLKFTFSRNILVFAITWLGIRDIYIAFIITLAFVFVADFLMNEDSQFCCLPKSFINKHVAMLEGFTENPSQEEIARCKKVLERANELENQETNLLDSHSNTAYNVNNIPNMLGY